ncbi:MAG TPA: PilZ domain-containing protein [Candidatus Hydrogenedentes bacterium]|nr:PilZ domain-containing protein [Candidatus Hydrogenedentota bacterium]HOV72765.1 PilZ domain-containing protein [Candidatus Hydrogenedentota bacterium]HPC17658.1 PilZ domain-containing protein [Candidatus Hydrogenedentota bacterium]HRT21283.1 PilZ domain-containing protein [Candidatus Hydrogenedentota bacterium]HRT65516.1 PilZ domain-containing protein [Candidatus Hydrogenedentota bacterium]
MADDMFFTRDGRALRRGRRVAPRTETCRPCLLWQAEDPETVYPGVVMDMSPYGMRVRMIEALPQGATVTVQMMRDEEYTVPLSDPVEAHVARVQPDETGFMDHGVRILQKVARRKEGRRVRPPTDIPAAPARATRMYTMDITLGERRRGRGGR